MLKYCLKRIMRACISLVIVIAVVFCLLRLMPIDSYFPNLDDMTEIQLYNAKEKLGLNDPVPVQLGNFYQQLLRGDLGLSNKYRVDYPITKILAKKAPVSIKFGLMAMGISLPLGLLLGVLMARNRNGILDRVGTGYVVLMQAVPAAVYYLMVQIYGSDWTGLNILYKTGVPSSIILPVVSLALPSIAWYAMWLRRYMVDEENKDYIRMARAKGVPQRAIGFNHVFRNAIVPLIHGIPSSLLLTISGSIYVESLYAIPGMGGLLVEVIKMQDNSMVQALVIVYAALGIIGLLMGDILMAVVDPRISLTKKEGAR